MNTAMPQYQDTQKAYHPWVKNIPAHWREHRAKVYFREIDDRSTHGKEELLSVSHMTGITPRSQKNITMFKAESYAGHKLCQSGDIVINTMWAWMGALGVSRYSGIISPSYGVYRTRKPDTFIPGYLDYLLRTQAYVSEYICRSTGIRSSRLRLYPDQFLCIPILRPRIDEQRQIVAYLRAYDHKFKKLIRGKQRLIKLLNEQKQTIIHHAVTNGLDPNASLKSSGNRWIGKVPEHWDIKPLKAVANVQFSGVDKHSHKEETPVLLCNYVDVYKNDFITTNLDFMKATASLSEIKRFALKVDDIILTKDSESPDDIGVSSLVKSVFKNLVCAYHLALLRPKVQHTTSEFLFRVLSDVSIAHQFRIAATGVTRFGLSKHNIKNVFVPVPSNIREQENICTHINNQLSPIESLVIKNHREIELIQEYRDRLISDVVTGQVDVRGWKPLPKEKSEDPDFDKEAWAGT